MVDAVQITHQIAQEGALRHFHHDYKRNGTTTLFAALSMLDGKVIGQCHARHRHQEWLKFLRCLDREYPRDLTLHVVMDNYGTHKAPAVQAWLAKHPRFVCHFIPTSSSWLNMVERWFRELKAGMHPATTAETEELNMYSYLRDTTPESCHNFMRRLPSMQFGRKTFPARGASGQTAGSMRSDSAGDRTLY